jgi:PIN domain nuclease of toxin-antitoxin system
MNYLLDTHIFLWFVTNDKRLSNKVKDLIKNDKNQIYLSVVSNWEATIKYQLGKIDFPKEASSFLSEQREIHFFKSLFVSEKAISYLHLLPDYHKDLFDRLLICQANENNFIFITADGKISDYREVKGFHLIKN